MVGERGMGTSCAAAGAGANARMAVAKPASSTSFAITGLEVHLGRVLSAGLRLEVRFWREASAEQTGIEHGREALARGVEGLRRLVVAHALHRDAIFGPFQL